MNIHMNNTNWFSQYSLINRLFSQKNANKAGIPNQAGANASKGVKHKHSNLYYDENGVPWMSKEQADRCVTGRSGWKKIVPVSDEVKAELAEVVKQDFISTNGKSIPQGTRRNDVINKYLSTIPSKQRSSASWTLDRTAGEYALSMEKLVRENNPGWRPGDIFDTSILDQLDGTLGGVDFRA